MDEIGNWVIPLLVFVAVFAAVVHKVPVFDTFVSGAKDGAQSTLQLLPTLVGLIMAVYMLRASGAFDILAYLIRPVTDLLQIPPDLVPLIFLRPVSGSGASAYVAVLLEQHGPDSLVGRMASVLASSTETTFYAAAVYLGSAGYKKSGWVLPAALLGDLAAAAATIVVVNWLF